ncbi:hypothetical protein GGX14DRAFT_419043 [Mycena pura]|uniref:SET domain-containing protein n=1 Tax=Mycena pura TaxID=153505 RepID=A0AAD7E4S9_9AGAR|nr:hypothetical protein GGX14DRAFT_419043 [Mycena pura]
MSRVSTQRRRVKRTKYEAREIWERSPSPTEDWGDDADKEYEWDIVGEEYGYGGNINQQVLWKDWARPDGSRTTWEGPTTTSRHLPTPAWTARRDRALPNAPDIVLWGTTDIVNTRTREMKQGFDRTAYETEQEVIDANEELADMEERMSELRVAEIIPDAGSHSKRTTATNSQGIAEAGPSRLRRINRNSSWDPKRKASSPLSDPPPPPRKRRAVHREPRRSTRRAPSTNEVLPRTYNTSSSTPLSAHSPRVSDLSTPPAIEHPHTSMRHLSDSPVRTLKRKAEDNSPRVCACGMPLPHVYRRKSVCHTCSDSENTVAQNAVETISSHLGDVVVKAPLPARKRKGKTRESIKSLRLQIETSWSTIAHEAGGAAGITFVNDVDDEEVPPTLSGNDWEFVYLEDAYYLPQDLESIQSLDFDPDSDNPLTAVDRLVYCECTECLDVASCACQLAHSDDEIGYAYTKGLFNFEYPCSRVVVECNAYCHCPASCPNRVAQQARMIPIEIYKTERCGWGVRSPVDVERGQVLGVYTGPRALAALLTDEEKGYCFDLDYHEDDQDDLPTERLFSVDSLRHGNWTRFINHSCAPNLRVQPVVHDTIPEQNVAYLAFIAMEWISAGSEFTFDYNPKAQCEVESREGNSKGASRSALRRLPGATECMCGAPRCRGWVW